MHNFFYSLTYKGNFKCFDIDLTCSKTFVLAHFFFGDRLKKYQKPQNSKIFNFFIFSRTRTIPNVSKCTRPALKLAFIHIFPYP